MLDRIILALGALSGLLGVGLSAAAAHLPNGSQLDTAARFLLIHGAALVGIAALIGAGTISMMAGRIAAAVMIVGLALFAGDLVLRAFRGVALFPMAAPTGGIALMLGWAALVIAAFLPGRS